MGKKGHIPIRMCIGCGERRGKKELIRFIKKPDGSVMRDQKGHLPGRGFYICPNENCFKKAQKKVKEISLLNSFEV